MMTIYESLRHPGTFIHANNEDIDPKTKTILYLDADGKNKSMSVATLKRWYKPVDDWDSAMEKTETPAPETAEITEVPASETSAELAETEAPIRTETEEPKAEEMSDEELIGVAQTIRKIISDAPKAKRKNMARKPKSLKVTELTWNGETKSLRDWAKELSIPYLTLYDRINRNGWSVEEAIKVPLGMSRKEFKATA